MSLTIDENKIKIAEKDEEFQKLYALLSGLSSKANPKKDDTTVANATIIPMISLMEVTQPPKSESSKNSTPLTDAVRLDLSVDTQLPAIQTSKPVQDSAFPPRPLSPPLQKWNTMFIRNHFLNTSEGRWRINAKR